MAYYKHIKYLKQQKGSEFDELHWPGSVAPLSGLYRCEGCGVSIVAHNAKPLPSREHHAHKDDEAIRWRLIVRSHLG